jgi:topoisomerase IA-like protein
MPTVQQHFKGRAPAVWTIYQQILSAAGAFGPFVQEPKKTSIHLVRKSAFAGVATRKDALILTLKSATDIRSQRIAKREQASSRRWHVEIRLDDPKQVDAQLKAWLKKSVDLSA